VELFSAEASSLSDLKAAIHCGDVCGSAVASNGFASSE